MCYFNPLPPCGGRRHRACRWQRRRLISIHSPRVGGDSKGYGVSQLVSQFQSTPPVWGETAAGTPARCTSQISIHSPRVGGDAQTRCWYTRPGYFNPLPPCGGRRRSCSWPRAKPNFNPLPPCGGRPHSGPRRRSFGYFNPLPPCGGRPPLPHRTDGCCPISIHSPRAGGDEITPNPDGSVTVFQSTPPVWGETSPANDPPGLDHHFNPLPPCGGRLRAK